MFMLGLSGPQRSLEGVPSEGPAYYSFKLYVLLYNIITYTTHGNPVISITVDINKNLTNVF